jgi:hypothetical protein
MKELPEEMRAQAKLLINKYRANGWSHISIGLPDASPSETPTIWLWATGPRGKRIYCSFDRNATVLERIDVFLKST